NTSSKARSSGRKVAATTRSTTGRMLIRSRVGGGSPLSGVLDDIRMPLHLPHLLTSLRTGSLGAGACDAGDMPWLVMEGRVLAPAALTAGLAVRAPWRVC